MRRLKVILGCPDDVETAAANDAPSCPSVSALNRFYSYYAHTHFLICAP